MRIALMKFGKELTCNPARHWIFFHTCIRADFVPSFQVCHQNAATCSSEELDQMEADLKLELRKGDRGSIDGFNLKDGIA